MKEAQEKRYIRKDQLRPQKRLFSLQDSSIYLGRSINSVRQMLWDGKIPFIKDGKRVFIDVKDLETWIEQSKQTFTF
jgi:excisionase family DNA binding protein